MTQPQPVSADNELRNEIKTVLNRHSRENGSNTPDHILADYLLACLAAFDAAVDSRARWYGRMDTIEYGPVSYPW